MIGPDATVEASVLWDNNEIGAGAALRACVVGRGNQVGPNAHLADGTIMSDNCTIGGENRLERGIRIWPDTELKDQAISF